MRILCIADIHGDIDSALKARKFAEENDIGTILILGDFPGHGVFGNIEQSLSTIKTILEAFSGMKVLAIPGNCDPRNSPDVFAQAGVNLHEAVRDEEGFKIAGFGGSGPTPFDTPFEMDEESIYSKMRALLSPLEKDNTRTLLALHCPPKDTACDKTSNGTHAGSGSVRRAIEEFQPRLAVCSHIHEAGGSTDVIGKTMVANIGRLSNGNAGMIELKPDIRIALLNIRR